jgi:putative tryptophan/tyrosine transport system substrate-binding protein
MLSGWLGQRMQSDQLKRREFITLLGGAAATWPLAARAQQAERVRLIGVLMNITADDLPQRANIAAFQQVMAQSGWTDGRNVKIDVRWSGGDVVRLRKDAEELLGLRPDVIVAGFGPTTGVLQQLTRTVPIVFTTVVDPVGAGFVDSLARPGGNATGFIQAEYTLSGKWLELLREIAPQVSRVGVIRTAGGVVGIGQWAVIGAFASPMGVELRPINVSVTGETERALSAFAGGPNSGLIVTVSDVATIQRELIIALAARHRLPTVYPHRFFVEAGGLISYGPDLLGLFRQGAGYVDRILKGEKPADLPVQAPTKYELVINLKTAKALGLEVPPTLLARADEVIE